jgi:23S rRNA pseudouridine1911/1915/1917 synthase
MELNYIVDKDNLNIKLRDVLSYFHISHRLLITLKNENAILVNGETTYIDKYLKLNDKININFDYEEDNSNIVPTKIDLDIVYEDDWIIIINKPSNLTVHPTMMHYDDSLSNGIRYYFDQIGLKKKIRPVNRIDKDTSGLVVFAKCEYIQEELKNQMANDIFKKEYTTIVEGILDNKKGIIDAPISRKEGSIIERCVDDKGAPSITEYEILSENKEKNYSLIKCDLKTGRTHQIRVHFSYIGHPLIGDDLYGGKLDLMNRQALHCSKITFIHPITKKQMEITSELAEDMKRLLALG